MSEFLYPTLPTKEERRAKRKQELVIESLAASSAGDAGALRLALAEIVAEEHGTWSYGGGCSCGGTGKGKKKKTTTCNGHVPETMKIARRALGLPALPDSPRVLSPTASED